MVVKKTERGGRERGGGGEEDRERGEGERGWW